MAPTFLIGHGDRMRRPDHVRVPPVHVDTVAVTAVMKADNVRRTLATLFYRAISGILNSCGVELDEGVPGWPVR